MQISLTDHEQKILKDIGACAQKLGQKAFVVGGFVRDRLLNRFSKDIDIVCEGSGIELAKLVSKQIKKATATKIYSRFGTAMVRIGDDEIEFVGARKESYSSNSRKPIVKQGTIADDQLRRDFTVNTLAISIQEEDFGEVVDPFDGLLDLKNKILRTPQDPNTTFIDDPLRILRGIRFASQLNFSLSEETKLAMTQNADRLKIISQERIHTEFNKVLLSPKPSIGLALLSETKCLPYVLPELQAMHGVDVRNGIKHKDNFWHTLQVVDNLADRSNDLWLRWSSLLHDIGKPRTKRFEANGWTFHGHEVVGAKMVPKIFKRLKLPMDNKMKYVQKMVRFHQKPIALTEEEVTDSALRRLLIELGDDIDDLLTLCEADITSKNPTKVKRYLRNYKALRDRIQLVEQRDQLRNWQPPISGEDIMTTFGIKPSRNVGSIKNAIREAILEGEIPNEKEKALHFMLAEAQKLGLEVKVDPFG